MSSTAKGFAVRDVTVPHGWQPFGQANYNVGKVLPATATGNLFVVTGAIQASLVGVVSVVGSASSVKISLGYTGNSSGLASPLAAGVTTQAVGSIFKLPRVLGNALPAPVTGTGSAASCSAFVVSNTTITITTDATNTMAITWILMWAPVAPAGQPVSGVTVTNS